MATKKNFIDYLIIKLDIANLSKNTIKCYKECINEIKNKDKLNFRSSIHSYINHIDSEIWNLENNYNLDNNLKSALKDAMYLEYNLFNKYMDNFSNLSEKLSKNIILDILNSKLISFNLYNNIYNSLYTRDTLPTNEIYCCNEFYVDDNALNLIINNIIEEGNTLYINGYILNLKKVPLSMISNFHIQLKDARGIPFASKVFKNIDIDGYLGILKGKNVNLPFFNNEYNLFSSDLSKISWSYTYDFA